ncbi:MAG: non-canonical purine NTP diphosphatase [Bacteroidaceae bacterium]|nr:non-canonical purine NTP diphosphatase [Bacteroidaceae bacterium]
MKLVFATNNAHKLDEIRAILGNKIEILSLNDIDCHDEIPETADTLEGNALQKAMYIKEHYGYDCFADDTGLEVSALGGAPGVHTARYAENTDHDSEANMNKLLKELDGKNNRDAQFRTVIALLLNGEQHLFEGIVKGNILTEKRGTQGFGYDPVFSPEEYSQSFAELGAEVKNKISHRARAVAKLVEYLNK